MISNLPIILIYIIVKSQFCWFRNKLVFHQHTKITEEILQLQIDISVYCNFSISSGIGHCERSEAISLIALRLLRRWRSSQWQKITTSGNYPNFLRSYCVLCALCGKLLLWMVIWICYAKIIVVSPWLNLFPYCLLWALLPLLLSAGWEPAIMKL